MAPDPVATAKSATGT